MSCSTSLGNNRGRLDWFNEIGFGLFIHWSIDSQIGSVIGHSMAGASDEYVRKFVEVLPSTFSPKKFVPDDWAVLAKLAGIRYVVFTTKHHSGFCMFHTTTTSFNIANTPYQRDITAEIIEAFRRQGIAIGLYFSPDDFHFLWGRGMPLRRGVRPAECAGLLDHNLAQLAELLSNYGKIDIMFFDGPSDGLREACWDIDDEIVITRGAIQTPEQYIPGVQSNEPWEACVTMGTGWQYKPTNEHYKSGSQLIGLLIETRAKGGNFVLNIGPKPDGELPIEQDSLLREIALWNFVNEEAVFRVRPWHVPAEGGIWLTHKEADNTVYAFLNSDTPWPLRERREFSLASVRAGDQSTVHILGQAENIVVDDRSAVEWNQTEGKLKINVARTQRLYNNRRWPNPVVVKVTHAQPGIVSPSVVSGAQTWDMASSSCLLHANLTDLGGDGPVEVGFHYRFKRLLTDPQDVWEESNFETLEATGEYCARISDLENGNEYEYRAVARHQTLTAYGDSVTFRTD